MRLGSWLWCRRLGYERAGHEYTEEIGILGAPRELLQEARSHLAARVTRVRARPPSARVRATLAWLARWSSRVDGEIDRQERKQNLVPGTELSR
jgi:hypothetical protein